MPHPKNDSWAEGHESVVSWYREMADDNRPYYSVWSGTNLRFTYDGTDIDEGADLLTRNIMMGEEMGNSTVMYIRLHKNLDSNGTITQKSPYTASLPFRCIGVEYDPTAMYRMAGNGLRDKFSDRIAAIEKKLDGGSEPRQGLMGMVDSILMNEQVQPMIAQAVIGTVMGIIGKFVPGVAPAMVSGVAQTPGPALAGLNERGKDLDWALDTLEKNDPNFEADMVKLAEISEANPPMFSQLLTMLRQFQ